MAENAGIAIVAIPSQNDYVWKVSSEKIPHLTLLFLGKQLDNVGLVEEFLEHVADTSLHKFGLDVDRRGILGDNSADVLFFRNRWDKMLDEFREYLLQNTDIFKAYKMVEQYPEWTPHLTLGYPESPAKPDKREHPGINWVDFDRIALWMGDYEGIEFPLKNELSYELQMSAKGEAFLQHFGVKGMKWGVIRDHAKSGGEFVKEAYTPSKDAINAQKYQVKAKLGGVRALNNHEMSLVIRRMELEQKYRDLYGERQLTTKGARWAKKFANDVLKDAAASWLKRPGSNFSGRTSATAWRNGQVFSNVIEGSIVNPRAIGR